MLAYLVAGLITGGLAWLLKHESGDARLGLLLVVGVVSAALGGVGMNAFLRDDLMSVTPWGFAAAAIVSIVVLGLLQAGVGRGGSPDGSEG